MTRSRTTRSGLCAVLALPLAGPAIATEAPTPPHGCFGRVYAAAHMASHPGQSVRRILVRVGWDASSTNNMFGTQIWVTGRRQVWRAGGSCKADGNGWTCQPDTDGDPEIAIRASGANVIFANPTRLKIFDDRTGPGLNDMQVEGAANRAFLLSPVPADRCKAE